MTTSKSIRRTEIINSISELLVDQSIYSVIDYHNKNEDYVKQFVYQPLRDRVSQILSDHYRFGESVDLKDMADKILITEMDKRVTLSNMNFLGCQHRPDMAIEFDDIKIAIEFKIGNRGASIREMISQAIIYPTSYDFSISLFLDTSKDKKIAKSIEMGNEREFINSLWDNYNAKVLVI